MALTKNLMSQIPKDFYRLFGSKYMDYYMTFLVAICEESSRSGSTLGLTEQECRTIINEKLTETTIDWSEERFDEEGSLLTRSNMAAVCLNYFEEWGWLRKDYDETLNSYVVSFPEYSQLYVELFQKLYKEEDSSERESVLASIVISLLIVRMQRRITRFWKVPFRLPDGCPECWEICGKACEGILMNCPDSGISEAFRKCL